jgi:hypothetical protein
MHSLPCPSELDAPMSISPKMLEALLVDVNPISTRELIDCHDAAQQHLRHC